MAMIEKINVYICKHCLEEHRCSKVQHYKNGRFEDPDDSEFEAPQKCMFCGSKSFTIASYHKDVHDHSGAYWSTDEYKAYETLLKSLSHQPEYDSKLHEALIEKRRNRRGTQISLSSVSSSTTSKPKCPTCGSTHVHPISTGKKAAGFFIAGIFSSNFGKSYECDDCKYKW